jgi:hypothetical protein
MKKTGLLVLLLATASWAQSGDDASANAIPQGTAPTVNSFPTERVQTPTYADLYCSGFINKQSLPDANYVAGGLETPSTTKFTRGDMIYMQGTGYSAGAEYEIVRALKDLNRYEMYPGQKKLLKETGQPYEEVGRVKVIDTRSESVRRKAERRVPRSDPFRSLSTLQQQDFWPYRHGQGFRFRAGYGPQALHQCGREPGRESGRLLPGGTVL